MTTIEKYSETEKKTYLREDAQIVGENGKKSVGLTGQILCKIAHSASLEPSQYNRYKRHN